MSSTLRTEPSATTAPSGFTSLLFEGPDRRPPGEVADASSISDLHLDQIVDAIVGKREEGALLGDTLYRQVHDIDTLRYRQGVFRDLEDRVFRERVSGFSEKLRQVRTRLTQLEKVDDRNHRDGLFLDAAAIYCDAVESFSKCLDEAALESRGLVAFRQYLTSYVARPEFATLAADTHACKESLARITYLVRVRGLRVDVSRYDGEPDYSSEVEETFERFQQGAVADYRVAYRSWPVLGHVGAQILACVARLFTEEFAALDEYCRRHRTFFDQTIDQADRELQFYLAYLDYVAPLREAGLAFCYPELSDTSKAESVVDTFDLALAAKLVGEGKRVVTNEFHLDGAERVIVVSGPNQGGKTTFARTFGQLHHLASVGCPVPGRAATLFLFDHLFTHFEEEEDLARAGGKLEDDLTRMRRILELATSDSVVVVNEIFTSTTLHDARFLGKKVLGKVVQMELLCVYVTFVDELASFSDSVVSMVSTIVPHNPSERTYKVVRKPADGLAYALAIAEKYDVTYERLRERVRP